MVTRDDFAAIDVEVRTAITDTPIKVMRNGEGYYASEEWYDYVDVAPAKNCQDTKLLSV